MTANQQNLFEYLSGLLKAGHDPVEREREIWREYGQTVAVMVLDSTGFTRVSDSHGIIHFLSRLVVMREIVAPILARRGCSMTKFEADNAFATFSDLDQAIRAAREIHSAVLEQDLMLTETERFEVCIGIGYGAMLYSDTMEGFFGEEMNRASKLGEDIAVGGEILITELAFDAASKEVKETFARRAVTVSGMDISYYRALS